MNIVSAIILGVVQGLTEFLPVSSSGHLVIVQSVMPNFKQPGVLFDTFLHAGTLGAVLIYFRRSFIKLIKDQSILYIVGTIPAVLVGVFFSDLIETLFSSTWLVGLLLLLTGLMNFMIQKTDSKNEKIKLSDSVFIGVFQALAILPGVSRSGSTIFAATRRGIKKSKAAEFSFILSIPAVLGANLYQIFSYSNSAGINWAEYLSGFLAALFSGYWAIRLVFNLLKKNKFNVFGLYCIVMGLLVLLI